MHAQMTDYDTDYAEDPIDHRLLKMTEEDKPKETLTSERSKHRQLQNCIATPG